MLRDAVRRDTVARNGHGRQREIGPRAVLPPAVLPPGFTSGEEYVSYCELHGTENPSRKW